LTNVLEVCFGRDDVQDTVGDTCSFCELGSALSFVHGHTSMMARFVYGVSDGTLITAVHPVAMTGATLRAIIAAGKFHLYISLSFLQPQTATHGTSKEQTPIGCLMTTSLVPGMELGTISP
jgi:hypothetical protein